MIALTLTMFMQLNVILQHFLCPYLISSRLVLSVLGPYVVYKLLRSLLPVLHTVLQCALGGASV